jgi:hypothetical protein
MREITEEERAKMIEFMVGVTEIFGSDLTEEEVRTTARLLAASWNIEALQEEESKQIET